MLSLSVAFLPEFFMYFMAGGFKLNDILSEYVMAVLLQFYSKDGHNIDG